MSPVATLTSGPVLLDASFVLGLLDSEPSAQRFADVLPRSVITAVNFGEVVYKVRQLAGIDAEEIAEDLGAAGLVIEPTTFEDAVLFGRLKEFDAAAKAQRSTKARSKSLSLADICCLAYAWRTEVPVLTGDRHWLSIVAAGLPVEVIDYRDPDAELTG